MEQSDQSVPNEVRLEPRLSDFRPRRDILLLQPGCMCCSCCCLHWVGAAIGGGVGLAKAWKPSEQWAHLSVSTKRSVWVWSIWGAFAAFVVLGLLVCLQSLQVVNLIGLVFVPSLAFVPVGLGAIAGAVLASPRAGQVTDANPEKQLNAVDLACRIAWKSFWYSTIGSIIGYGIMLLIMPLMSMF